MKKYLFFILSLMFALCVIPVNHEVSSAETVVELPVIMYHSLLKSRTGAYITSPAKFKSDLTWLKERGYTSVFVQDIIDHCEGRKALPDKPVLISFDDGHYNNYYYAFDILKELDFKANINIIGCHSEFCSTHEDRDNPNYSHLTWGEIKEMQESGIWEVGNHTYNMHKFQPRYGVSKMYNESSQEYEKNLTHDVMRLQDKFEKECGFTSNVFAFPFGKYSKESLKILSDCGFKAFLTCNEKINKLEFGNASKLQYIGRFNRTGTLSTYEFFKKIGLS